MTREEALRALKLGHALPAPDDQMVRARFSAFAKQLHPDTLVQGGETPPDYVTLADLKKARDVLLSRPDRDCLHCRGSGWVMAGFRKERCPRGC